jgi:DNA-binding NarL/FixJ family response regulator
MNSASITIAMADDHKALKQAFQTALSFYPDISFIFEASNGAELLDKLQQQHPDVLLLDLHMPLLSGIEALKVIHSKYPSIPILIFTAFTDEVYVQQCLECGINGFLTKTMDIEEIVKAIRAASKNEVYYTNLLNNSLFKDYLVRKKKALANLLPQFSNEELKILTLLSEEKNTDEISDILNLSKRSIELKRDKMRHKAKVKTVAGLVLYAFKRNLIV